MKASQKSTTEDEALKNLVDRYNCLGILVRLFLQPLCTCPMGLWTGSQAGRGELCLTNVDLLGTHC